MNLLTYLEKNNISREQAAQKLNCSAIWIYLHTIKGRPLGKKTALKVEKWTNGEVSAEESMHIRKE